MSIFSQPSLCSDNYTTLKKQKKEMVTESQSISPRKGFKIDNDFKFLKEIQDPSYTKFYNGSRLYGYGKMWSALYSYFDDTQNDLYLLCLAESEIEPVATKTWDNPGWWSKSMTLDFWLLQYDDATVYDYSPETFESEKTVTWGISCGASEGISSSDENVSVSASASYSETTTYTSISANARKSRYSNCGVTIQYCFNNYNMRDRNDCSHYLVKRKYMVLFKLPNYSNGDLFQINVKYKGEIYRNGYINQTLIEGYTPLHWYDEGSFN